MKPNGRSIGDKWDTWTGKERVDWLNDFVWGGRMAVWGTTAGATEPMVKFTHPKVTHYCRICGGRDDPGTVRTIQQIEKHINSSRHKANYILSKLGGE